MWLPFPISDDIIIQLFLFFTNSFHNPSSIFCIDRGIVSTTLLKVVCKLRMCNNPIRCHYDPREFVLCCLNSFCIEGWCMTTTARYLSYTLYRCDVCTYTFQSCDQSSLSLHDHIDIKDRHLFLPTCYCIKTTENRATGMSNERTSSPSLCKPPELQ